MRKKFSSENQGEGNRDAARRYNQKVEEHARSGKSKAAADRAGKDVDGPGADELQNAEREGKRRIAEEDPEVDALLGETNRNVVPGMD
jgi:hypothetical protein